MIMLHIANDPINAAHINVLYRNCNWAPIHVIDTLYVLYKICNFIEFLACVYL